MRSEKDLVYELETEVSDLNENNYLKPYGYQEFFARLVEPHLVKINADIETTMKSNLAWALVSLSIGIINPVKGCVKLFGNTWHSQHRGPFFRRDFVMKNEAGEIMFRGASYSVLLDLEKRSIYRGKDLSVHQLPSVSEFALEASPTNKMRKTELEFCKVDERKVYNSFIDCLGHVNNCRYGEFAYDAFTDEERDALGELKRMDIYFHSELKSKDVFSIRKAYEEKVLYFQGYNDTRSEKAFEYILTF
ncbi:MAG: hypothetical protein KBA53_05960 [Thermoclostridium sp.]|nr:hypothetical protein [Thermoclostridium sp.]